MTDFERLLKALASERVDFILVGGGCCDRARVGSIDPGFGCGLLAQGREFGATVVRARGFHTVLARRTAGSCRFRGIGRRLRAA